MGKPKIHRLQFDVTDETLAKMDALKSDAGAHSRAELVRNSLHFYAWFLDKREKGWKLQLKGKDKVIEVELLF